MVATLPNYQIVSLVAESLHIVIYRGFKQSDRQPVILKILKNEYPSLEEITSLRHEYEIARKLNIYRIVKALDLINYKNGLVLVLEDFGGTSLKNLLATQKLSIVQFLKLAIQIVESLEKLHHNRIIHKDIKPANLIVNTSTSEVKITDFSIASRLSKENPTISTPALLEGTLAYMSPEQTGRMNRSIDYRSDYYSLGVTFYEMLTGELPFTSTDPMELIHCHIAKQPVPLKKAEGRRQTAEGEEGEIAEIPKAISDIVMKLMAKTAEDRYQSAEGLKYDLEFCLTQLEANGTIPDFTVGARDLSGQLLIPQKLYGREEEVAQLMNAFERVAKGKVEMMLVSGYSGIGKSSLVHEIHKPIVRQKGYFISGKFDQYKRNIPYAAIVQAFQELMRQLLAESASAIALWKEKFLEALGTNAKVIIDVIPEVELIVGTQPPVPSLPPNEAQNRFNRLFQKFIQVLAKKESPCSAGETPATLVIFLDDLQWADNASLKLIQQLVTDPDSQYFLLIGAYRDNEVGGGHPLMSALEKIEAAGTTVNNITLQPLRKRDVNQLIGDTLGQTEQISTLANLLFNKTAGNPFFLTQLLSTLHQEKLLNFEFSTGKWQWDIGEIQAIAIVDKTVVELIAGNIQKLPESTQEVLKKAACIGNQFSLEVLAIAAEKTQTATAADLWASLQSGLILPLSNAYKIPMLGEWERGNYPTIPHPQTPISYKFLHDRVQQAAYSLILDDEKKETHLKIGQLLLKNTPPVEREAHIFDIVNQLNFGVEKIVSDAEKEELASLNLVAGKRAKTATAYEAAVRYLNVGLGLLGEDGWERQYDLAIALYTEAAEAEYLNGNFERSHLLAEVVLSRAQTLLEKVQVYQLQMQSYFSQNQMKASIKMGLQCLKMLEISLEREPIVPEVIEDLANLPDMKDPHKLAVVNILNALLPPTYVGDPEIFFLTVCTLVNLNLKYGNSPSSAYAYIQYSVICMARENIDIAYRFGQLALQMLEKFNAREFKSKVFLGYYCCAYACKEHVKKTLEPLQESLSSGWETGDLVYAAYSATNFCVHVFFIGEHLESAEKKTEQSVETILKLNQEVPLYYAKVWRQVILNLQGRASEKSKLISEEFNEEEMLPLLIKEKNATAVCGAYCGKLILHYLFKDSAAAAANAREAEKYAGGLQATVVIPLHNFYYSLALLACYPFAEKKEQQEYLNQVEANQEKMKVWAYHAPCNFQHKYDLIKAERARVLGQIVDAMEGYDRAIKGAKEQGYIQEEALANELAGEFYLSRQQEKIAAVYLTDAYYGYIRWGAIAKVRDLEERYPQFLSQIAAPAPIEIEAKRTTKSTTVANLTALLDFSAAYKASQAISEEIVLDKLLAKLMQVSIENAGAQTGMLFLEKDGKLLLAAEKCVESESEIALPFVPLEDRPDLPGAIVNYVKLTGETLVLHDAAKQGLFTNDPYIVNHQPKSILGLPIIYQGKIIGILYLENRLIGGAFTRDRMEVLSLLAAQSAISLENALLYASLEQKVAERTQELKENNLRLEETLRELSHAQTHLIQSEKMSSLGQLVAGVAHEINNPVNFIFGNLTHADEYTQQLLNLIQLYQQICPNPTPEVIQAIEDMDFDFLVEDLPALLRSMKVGADRIRSIVQSLRNFSRLDEAEMKDVNIHDGLDSTLLILQNRLQPKHDNPGIQVIKEYGNLPLVECYAGDLNQVFINLIGNAIDALEECDRHRTPQQMQANPSTIWILTEAIAQGKVAIRIIDNGLGMTEDVRKRLFDPFFTTKPIGKGTGIGLSISHQIVVEKHKGQLKCISAPQKGAEFIVEIPIKQASQRTGSSARS